MKKYHLKGDRLKPARLINYTKRLATRVATIPVSYLPEGRLKYGIRHAVLQVQNSLSTEMSVNKGDTVVQIGTPWPYTLRRFRRACGSSGRLVIFEAMPDNYKKLIETVEVENYDNVSVYLGAAWSERKRGTFLVSPYVGDHKIEQDDVVMDNDLREINKSMKKMQVEFYTIDDVLNEMGIGQINHLSVTVNGAEFEVLRGAKNILESSTDIRVYAKGHARLEDGRPISDKILPYLKTLGYTTIHTKGEPSSTIDERWLYRSGDVYAWKHT